MATTVRNFIILHSALFSGGTPRAVPATYRTSGATCETAGNPRCYPATSWRAAAGETPALRRNMHVRIVLVEPKEAGNVGAAARAMKNFGFHEMAIVGSRPQVTREASEWWAKGGIDVVQSARRYATLQEALAGVHLSVAATAVRARHVYEQLTPSD